MTASKQDGKASVPARYRAFIVSLYGQAMMDLVDSIGAKHDTDIARLGYILAAVLMACRLFFKTPWFLIALPISIGVILYSFLPQTLKNKYWS